MGELVTQNHSMPPPRHLCPPEETFTTPDISEFAEFLDDVAAHDLAILPQDVERHRGVLLRP